MTRVEERREAQRLEEQRRQDEKQQAKKQGERQEFRRLMSQKQAEARDASRQAQQAAARSASQRTSAERALLARQGIQAQRFEGYLKNKGHQANAETRTLLKEQGKEVRKTDEGFREQKLETKREIDRQEGRITSIDRDERRGGGGGGSSLAGDPGGAATGHEMGATFSSQGAEQASGAALVTTNPVLTPELVRQIVDRIFVGVNREGLSEFQIEFKENVLAGSRLSVSAKDGKIFARFESEDAGVRRLVKASEGELARALERKGLRLERLEVLGA